MDLRPAPGRRSRPTSIPWSIAWRETPQARDTLETHPTVVGMVVDGMTRQEIVDAFPDLEGADIDEVLCFAATALRERQAVPRAFAFAERCWPRAARRGKVARLKPGMSCPQTAPWLHPGHEFERLSGKRLRLKS